MNPTLYAILSVAAGILLAVLGFLLLMRLVRVGSGSPATSEHAADRTARNAAGTGATEVMSGGLQHMALADLLQFLAQGGHTGLLQINSGRRAGTIRLVQGLVVHAEYRRQVDLDALFEMLSLQIGDFRFQFEPPTNEPVRGREVVDILMLWLEAKEEAK